MNDEVVTCPTCNGTGEIIDKDQNVRICPQCGGTGVVRK